MFERRLYEPRLTRMRVNQPYKAQKHLGEPHKGIAIARSLRQFRYLFDSVAVGRQIGSIMVYVMQQTRTRPIILLVEDYADSRQMLALLLESSGYCVLPAANGKEALNSAA
jgi:PleD family two-component response regulator